MLSFTRNTLNCAQRITGTRTRRNSQRQLTAILNDSWTLLLLEHPQIYHATNHPCLVSMTWVQPIHLYTTSIPFTTHIHLCHLNRASFARPISSCHTLALCILRLSTTSLLIILCIFIIFLSQFGIFDHDYCHKFLSLYRVVHENQLQICITNIHDYYKPNYNTCV